MATKGSTTSLVSLASPGSLLKTIHATSRGSVASVESQLNGYAPLPVTQTLSASKIPVNGIEAITDVNDPDELFVKYPVAHIKAIQNRFRADADAKQEELRQMVGERYRDLLQASTSIISLSASSKHVLGALEDMSNTVPSREQICSPVRPAHTRKDDAQLQSLQSLSTHIKLLLDAPEHIWRLLERKQYLRAAWLFLLAGVVHRALINDDADIEESWESHGIDVEEQFPLVQRQWETVSQLRSQITHKSTLSLREHSMSSIDVCATLLTLHFLDSRPLVDTLSVLLAQRRRTVTSVLSTAVEGNGSIHPQKARTNPKKSKIRKSVVQEVKGRLQAVLDVISRTVSTARDIFQEDVEPYHQSMIRRVLAFIQSDSSTSSANALPKDLQLTTSGLLTDLPSSTHLLYLPPNIKAYKPYVDLSSSSAVVQQSSLRTKVRDWFDAAINEFETVAETWLEDLSSIEEVWRVRKMLLKWLRSGSELQEAERARLRTVLDTMYRKRISHLWRAALLDVDTGFQGKLSSVVDNLDESENDGSTIMDAFTAIPSLDVPQSSGIAVPNIESFLKYKMTIRRHLSGRTTLLDRVLEALEVPVRELRRSMDMIKSDKDDSEGLTASLLHEYRLEANKSCSTVLDILVSTLNNLSDNLPLKKIIFIGQIADALSSTSEFSKNISCSAEVANNFKVRTKDLYLKTVERWRNRSVESAVQVYWRYLAASQRRDTATTELSRVSRPSAALMRCLSLLVESVQQISITRSDPGEGPEDETLRAFITSLLGSADGELSGVSANDIFPDLLFLRKVIELWGDGWHDVSELITSAMEKLGTELNTVSEDSISDSLFRTQLLLEPLLPRMALKGNSGKQTALLRLGPPAPESTVNPVIDLVKPSVRFGLLLVESTFFQ
ncbi:hypothetical protein NEOLEDRAFT_1053694 [Neolentinus lepideus HHB14362 ss-1]|uniref:Conserved oligomeric Golgi complex subunit 1 n=1 Tax=Neolentinus lepideus HHB14362 ss-1 TaxID=1314782 RepID=A0A165W8D8_9AGAM|nr:hypothetical protein NEOLEDRAFT_1053694 [Neolentinus lepideus HHB14362 ss-1]